MPLILVAVSLLLQIAAAVLALRLTRISGRPTAWLVIAAAIFLMAIRRSITLARLIAGDLEYEPDVWAELVGLTVSLLMALGIASIAPILLRAKGAEEVVPQLLESAPDAMIIADADDKIVMINAQAVRLFGWLRHQLIGQDVVALIPERFRERHRDARSKYHENPQPRVLGASAEVFGLRKDGTEFPVEISVSPLDADDGTFVVSAIRDISKRRETEAAIKESEGRYRTLLDDVLDTSSVGVCLLDAKQRVIWANRTYAGLFGLRRQDLVGTDGRALVRDLSKICDDPETFRETMLKSYDENRYRETFEFRVLEGDGRVERWLEHRSQPIESGIIAGGRIEHYTDVTERSVAEQRIRQFVNIVRSMQIGLIVYRMEDLDDDRSLRLVTVNPEAERLLELGKEKMLGKLIDDVFPGLRTRGLPELFANVLRSKQMQEVEDFVYGDGRVIKNAWSFKAFPLPDQCVGVVFDKITDRKRIESLVENIAAGVVGETGDAYFRSFVTYLAKALDLEYAFVGELEADGKGVMTVAAFENGEIVDNFRYDLAGTPCSIVVGKGPCCHAEKVAEKFPEDRFLTERGIECYVGAPLFNNENTRLGLITVLGRRKLENPRTATSVLQIFATRAAAELERKRSAVKSD